MYKVPVSLFSGETITFSPQNDDVKHNLTPQHFNTSSWNSRSISVTAPVGNINKSTGKADQWLVKELEAAQSLINFSCAEQLFANNPQNSPTKTLKNKTKQPECSICHRAFASKSSLTRHAKKHDEIQNFICDHLGCDNKYYYNSSLKRHKIQHSQKHTLQQKLHECQFTGCHKKFISRSNLKTHVKTHINLMLLKCYECDVVFYCKKELQSHNMWHLEKESFNCLEPSCNEEYNTKYKLTQHINNNTSDIL